VALLLFRCNGSLLIPRHVEGQTHSRLEATLPARGRLRTPGARVGAEAQDGVKLLAVIDVIVVLGRTTQPLPHTPRTPAPANPQPFWLHRIAVGPARGLAAWRRG
jgi:hypothetical protein